MLKEGFLKLAKEAPRALHVPPRSHEELAKEQRRRDLRMASGVPARYAKASFAAGGEKLSAEWEDATDLLRRLAGEPGIMALLGRRGTGKTHMACALVNDFNDEHRVAWYRRAMDFFLEIKATYLQSATETQRDVQRRYERPDLLVLDEMQIRSDTPWEDMVLADLIDRRYGAEKSTILISNQDLKTFEKAVGESVIDRLNEDGGVITCDWPSLRGRV